MGVVNEIALRRRRTETLLWSRGSSGRRGRRGRRGRVLLRYRIIFVGSLDPTTNPGQKCSR